jgi:tetratricopeptide (TPR) repeat protein
VLLDRKRVKFWQKWVFLGMAIVMASFLIFGYSGVLQGCNKNSGAPSGSIGDAIKTAEAQLQAKPNDPSIMVQLGGYYESAAAGEPSATAQSTDWLKAAGYYEKAYAVFTRHKGQTARQNAIDTLNKIAVLYLRLSDLKSAVSAYQRLVTYQPRNAQNYFYLGNYAYQLGDLKTALQALQQYLKLDPKSSDANAIADSIKQIKAALASPTASPTPVTTRTPTPTPTKSGAK